MSAGGSQRANGQCVASLCLTRYNIEIMCSSVMNT